MSTHTMTLWLQDAARWCALEDHVRELEAQLAAAQRMRAVQDERIIRLVSERAAHADLLGEVVAVDVPPR